MLTGLPNRDFLERFMETCLARSARRSEHAFGLMLFTINDVDTHRRALGRFGLEEVLADVAERLYWAIRPYDVMARLDGDVFAMLIDEVRSVTDVARVATRIQRSLDRAVSLAGSQIEVTASIGITISRPNVTVQELLTEADAARERCAEQQADFIVFGEETHAQVLDALAQAVEVSQAKQG
jgi:diguanylate cyclase (GGDEF)-like protein